MPNEQWCAQHGNWGFWLWIIVSVSKKCPISSSWNSHIMQMPMHLYIHITRSSGWYKALCCVNLNLFVFWQVCNGFGQVSAQQRNFGSLVDQSYVVLIVAHEWVELDRILYDCAFCGTQQSPYSLTVCQRGMPHKQLCSGRLFFQSWYFQPGEAKWEGKSISIRWPKDDRRANHFCGPRPNQRGFWPAVDKPSRLPTLQHFLG